MNFEIRTLEVFDRQAKRLAKHYTSFRQDYINLLQELQENPLAGTDLGGGIRKVRMAIASKGKGKSGGARVITYTADIILHAKEGTLILLSIYDKSEHSTISDKEIKRLKELAIS
ncbi:MAG: type II toxin-antitoxin system RelE/ParE family toxin [Bacteroidaceae bacterium]|nr:type II toxin-antitoxin system RelE/ParE family toxin [Bacteroidaceae bacterium]